MSNETYLASIAAICADIKDIYIIDCVKGTLAPLRRSFDLSVFISDPEKKDSYDATISAYIGHFVNEEDRPTMREHLRLENICRLLQKEESVSIFYRVGQGDDAHYYRLKCTRLGDGKDITRIVYAFMPENFDVSQAHLLHALETDTTTGVFTKQAFYHHAAEMLGRNFEKEYDLILTNVVNFKLVNQTYGRAGGDKLLQFLAKIYTGAARGGICARYSADQFVILTESMADDELPVFFNLLEKMRAACPLPYQTFRYGVVRHVSHTDPVAEMCDKATLALRSSEKMPDTPAVIYSQDTIRDQLRRQLFESDFERALQEKEFVVWCQPKYNAFTRRITSAEALVRWQSKDGFISPGAFIPIFESDGLISRLDEYVFSYVCRRQKEWLSSGRETVPISVNLSRTTLLQQGSVERYSRIVEDAGIPRHLVPLELTESATIENTQVASLTQQLRDTGFELHMDDFGSGFSSLSSLTSLRFNAIKLDKSLIDAIGNARGDEMMRHVIELCHFMEMEVVAEGVENLSQYNFLKKLGCDTIQGYYFSRPLPFDDYLCLLLSQPGEVSESLDSAVLADQASVGSLRVTNDLKLQYLSALASIFMTIHVIDLREDTVVEFATTTNVKEHANRVHGITKQMSETMTATVAPESLADCLAFTDLTTIAQRLKGKRTLSEEFVGRHFGRFRARFVTVSTDENDEPVVVIFTTQVVEADRKPLPTAGESAPVYCRTDELTGVFNKTAFDEDLAALTSVPDNFTVFSVDINGMKAANAAFGRRAGDELLCGTAQIMNDLFSKTGTVYRIGGDRFIALFRAEDALKKTEALFCHAVKNWIGDEVRSLSVSYGVSTRRGRPEMTLRDMLIDANNARLQYKYRLRAQAAGTPESGTN